MCLDPCKRPESLVNVLLCIPVLRCGGTEMQTLNLVRVLRSAGYRVSVCCYYERDDAVVEMFRQAGADVLIMGLRRQQGAWVLIRELRKLIRSLRPDIVHVQYVAPGLLPVLAARLAGVRRLLATVHYPGRTVGPRARMFVRIASRLCRIFLCVSQSAERSWFGDSQVFDAAGSNGHRRHYTLYNAVDVDRIAMLADGVDHAAVRRRLGLGDGPVVGIVARLRGEKGHAILLDAMAEVVREVPEARLLAVGDGADRDSLQEQARRLGIEGSVVWAGAKTQDEAFALYGVMDVVAVPSLFEGFGLSAAEAMAAGKPVVAAAADGLVEVVVDGVTGYLTPIGDSKALADAILSIVTQPEQSRAMGLCARVEVAERFSLKRLADATAAAYESVCGERRRNGE